MKTIAVPTDFSENAAYALKYAVELARHTSGKIILFHNIDVPANLFGDDLLATADYSLGTFPISPLTMGIMPELENINKEKLQELAAQLRFEADNKLIVETSYNWGSLSDNLNELIYNEAVDLVVMGTKGTYNFLNRLAGTNTASFIQVTQAPVLTIPTAARFQPFRNIAYATALEDDESLFLHQLVNFAESFKADITLVNVKSNQQLDIVADEQILNDIRKKFQNRNFNLVQLNKNKIAESIESFVSEHNFDLLAVAIHERSFLSSLFHTSISEQLALQSVIPLLALPENNIHQHQNII